MGWSPSAEGMVHCLLGCSNQSGRNKGVSFYQVVCGRSRKEEELSRKWREGYLSAISRADLTESVIENCSEQFLSGKPAGLFDETSPNWLPTEKLGHSKISRKHVTACEERYQRKKVQSERFDAAQSTHRSNCAEGSTSCSTQHKQHILIVEESQLGISSEVRTELTSQPITARVELFAGG